MILLPLGNNSTSQSMDSTSNVEKPLDAIEHNVIQGGSIKPAEISFDSPFDAALQIVEEMDVDKSRVEDLLKSVNSLMASSNSEMMAPKKESPNQSSSQTSWGCQSNFEKVCKK